MLARLLEFVSSSLVVAALGVWPAARGSEDMGRTQSSPNARSAREAFTMHGLGQCMKENNIHITLVSETKMATTQTIIRNGYTF